MAEVIRIADRRSVQTTTSARPATAGDIILFTGVRYERLTDDGALPPAGNQSQGTVKTR